MVMWSLSYAGRYCTVLVWNGWALWAPALIQQASAAVSLANGARSVLWQGPAPPWAMAQGCAVPTLRSCWLLAPRRGDGVSRCRPAADAQLAVGVELGGLVCGFGVACGGAPSFQQTGIAHAVRRTCASAAMCRAWATAGPWCRPPSSAACKVGCATAATAATAAWRPRPADGAGRRQITPCAANPAHHRGSTPAWGSSSEGAAGRSRAACHTPCTAASWGRESCSPHSPAAPS